MTDTPTMAIPQAAQQRFAVNRRLAWGIGGTIGVVALWELIGFLGVVPDYILPAPSQIVAAWFNVLPIIAMNLPGTLLNAAIGYLIGNAVAIGLAILAGMWKQTEGVVARLAVVAHCIPTIALAPILLIIAPDNVGVILAALGVFFATLVGLLTGMRYPDRRAMEAHDAFGGGRFTRLFKVKLPFGMPGMFSGLLLGVPAAIIGALIAEYLVVGRGLGGSIIAAQEQMNPARVWALCLTCALVSAAAFGIVAAVQRAALPWLAETSVSYGAPVAPSAGGAHVLRDTLLSGLVLLVIVCGIWYGGLLVFNITPFLGKTPWDVLQYLAFGPDATVHAGEMFGALLATLGKAALGLLLGTIAAVIVAAAFSAVPSLRDALMPTVLIIRSVPLLAMIPAIALAFGSGILTVVVLTSVLAFFPTLVTVLAALDSVPREISSLAHVYNASRFDVASRINAVYALPAILQALRITATGALLGAVVAEWLSSPSGIGYAILKAVSDSQFAKLWSAIAIVTIVSMLVYSLVVALESSVRRRIL